MEMFKYIITVLLVFGLPLFALWKMHRNSEKRRENIAECQKRKLQAEAEFFKEAREYISEKRMELKRNECKGNRSDGRYRDVRNK